MMEILQTIWTALTTENEGLTNTIMFPFYFIEAFIFMKIITISLNVKVTKKQKIIYIMVMSLSGIFTKNFIINPYNAFLNVTIFLLSNFLILRCSVLKSIVGLIIPFAITVFLESLLSKFYYIIFNIDYIVGMNIPIHRLIGNFIIYFTNRIIGNFSFYFFSSTFFFLIYGKNIMNLS